jgi:hypothetical protein
MVPLLKLAALRKQQRAIVLVAQQELTKAAENHALETQLHATMPLAVMPEEEELMILVVFKHLQIQRNVSAVRLGGYREKAAPSVNPVRLENPQTVINHIQYVLATLVNPVRLENPY